MPDTNEALPDTGASDDPLRELAALIGQKDPFQAGAQYEGDMLDAVPVRVSNLHLKMAPVPHLRDDDGPVFTPGLIHTGKLAFVIAAANAAATRAVMEKVLGKDVTAEKLLAEVFANWKQDHMGLVDDEIMERVGAFLAVADPKEKPKPKEEPAPANPPSPVPEGKPQNFEG